LCQLFQVRGGTTPGGAIKEIKFSCVGDGNSKTLTDQDDIRSNWQSETCWIPEVTDLLPRKFQPKGIKDWDKVIPFGPPEDGYEDFDAFMEQYPAAMLVQMCFEMQRVVPHPRQCHIPRCERLNYIFDPKNNGSGYYKFPKFPTKEIWGSLDGVVEEVCAQEMSFDPQVLIGNRINNGLTSYPFDNRTSLHIPFKTGNIEINV
jgi:hypothetical protein